MNQQNQPIQFVAVEALAETLDTHFRKFTREFSEHFQPIQPTKYLTRNEVCELLSVDLSTLHRWTKSGKLNAYGIGNRVYYLRSEVDEKILNSKIN